MSLFIASLLIYVTTTVGGLVALKKGSVERPPVAFRNNKIVYHFTPLILTGLALYGVSFLSYIYLLSKYDLGYIVPLAAAFVYISLFLCSYFILKEVFTKKKLFGISLIVLGVLVLNMHGLQ